MVGFLCPALSSSSICLTEEAPGDLLKSSLVCFWSAELRCCLKCQGVFGSFLFGPAADVLWDVRSYLLWAPSVESCGCFFYSVGGANSPGASCGGEEDGKCKSLGWPSHPPQHLFGSEMETEGKPGWYRVVLGAQ